MSKIPLDPDELSPLDPMTRVILALEQGVKLERKPGEPEFTDEFRKVFRDGFRIGLLSLAASTREAIEAGHPEAVIMLVAAISDADSVRHISMTEKELAELDERADSAGRSTGPTVQ